MRYSFFVFIVFAYSLCYSQGWQRRFRTPHTGNNYSKTIFETSPGHYVTLGSSFDTTNGGSSNKLRVIGLNTNGQVVWSKQYGDTNFYYYDNAYGYPYGFKKGNNIYYVGAAHHGNKVDGGLIKFSANGDTLWQRIYTDSAGIDVSLFRMNESVDGGFLLTGFSQNWNNNTNPCLIIKTNALGQELWRKKIHKAAPDLTWGYAILQDSATKKIIVGGYQTIGNDFWNIYDNILVLDSLGNNPSQSSTLGMGGIIADLVQTRDKKIVAVGAKTYSIDGYHEGVNRSYIFKFDINNPSSPLWLNEYQDTAQISSYNCVQELANGDILAGGSFDTSFYKNHGYQVVICMDRFSTNGNLISQIRRQYKYSGDPTENNQALLCLNPTSDGGYVAAIQTQYYIPYDQLFFIKYDSLFCDSTELYCAMLTVGINKASLGIDQFSIYPNPTINQLNIDLAKSKGEKLGLSICDLSGREIKRYLLESNYLDVSDLAPGLYLVHINNTEGRLLQTTRLIKR